MNDTQPQLTKMVNQNKDDKLVKRVHDNVLSVLREKEREVDEELSNIRQVESKISQLRDEDTLDRFREARLKKLKEIHAKRMEFFNQGYGKLIEVDSDSHFFDVARNTKYVVSGIIKKYVSIIYLTDICYLDTNPTMGVNIHPNCQ